jgi:phenylalanyl-tRNA synthetase beta chain
MKFTLSWLKDHLETDASLDDILYALTDLGLEVEGVENPAERLAELYHRQSCACGKTPRRR